MADTLVYLKHMGFKRVFLGLVFHPLFSVSLCMTMCICCSYLASTRNRGKEMIPTLLVAACAF